MKLFPRLAKARTVNSALLATAIEATAAKVLAEDQVAWQRSRMKDQAAEHLKVRADNARLCAENFQLRVALTALTHAGVARWNNPGHIPNNVTAVIDGDGCPFHRVEGGWAAPRVDGTTDTSSPRRTLQPDWAPFYEAKDPRNDAMELGLAELASFLADDREQERRTDR